MRLDESTFVRDSLAQALRRARELLQPPQRRDAMWPALAAAVFFAVSALTFATAAILAPPAHMTPSAPVRGAF